MNQQKKYSLPPEIIQSIDDHARIKNVKPSVLVSEMLRDCLTRTNKTNKK